MLKSILLFIKAHAVATTITAVVVVAGVTSVAVIPPMMENDKLNKSVEANLDKLVSSNFQTTHEVSKEITTPEEIDTSKPLTFTIERVETNYENGDRSVGYVIVPSYDKDFSKWTKEDKEAYDKILKERAIMVQKEGERMYQEEKQALADAELEVQKIINSWSKNYICGGGSARYNSYTKKYTGSYYTITTTSTTDSYGGISTEFQYLDNQFDEISVEDFKNNIYPKLLQNLETYYNDMPEYNEYKANLNELYNLSE